MKRTALVITVLLAVLGTAARAAPPTWQELSPEQQAILKPLENSWDSLPDQRRERLAPGRSAGTRWPEQRERAQQRLNLEEDEPQQRERIQDRRAEFRGSRRKSASAHGHATRRCASCRPPNDGASASASPS